MKQLTENDRGVFKVVTSSGSEYIWTITDAHTTVLRHPRKGQRTHHSMMGFSNSQDNVVSWVEAWPEVGYSFIYHLYGDVSWIRSSAVVSIERVAK